MWFHETRSHYLCHQKIIMPRNTITEDFVLRCDREIYEHLDEYTNNKKNVFYGMYISEMKQLIRPTVDLWNGLWNQGEMACLFGETNVGKTTLALQIANDLAKRGLDVHYYDFSNAVHSYKQRYDTPEAEICDNSSQNRVIINTLDPVFFNSSIDTKRILESLKKRFVLGRASVIIIDDITYLARTSDKSSVQHVLNTLRSWSQEFLVSILVVAHSRRKRYGQITTIDSLDGSFELAYAFESIFSISRANKFNADNNHITHYIKQHKNRNGIITYDDMNVITTTLGRDKDSGVMQFIDFTTGGNERQLLRDNGFNSFKEFDEAILQYKELHFSTREIASIVGCSQSHVSRTIRKHEKQLEKEQQEKYHVTLSGCNSATLPSINDDDKGDMEKSESSESGESSESSEPSESFHVPHSTFHPSSESGALFELQTWKPIPRPKVKLIPDLSILYDETKYVRNRCGIHITKEEYEEQCREEFYNPYEHCVENDAHVKPTWTTVNLQGEKVYAKSPL